MAFGIKLAVWGDLACFTRPEMKVERVTYDVITPSAARGILEAIYWKPQMKWVVDRLHILNPIRYTSVRRNEIASKIPVKGPRGVAKAMKEGKGRLGLAVDQDRQQRAARILCDVRYVVEAHVEIVMANDGERCPAAKHLEMFKRRAAKGQYFHQPYLGNREFPAFFSLVDEKPATGTGVGESLDLGLMLHDIVYVPSDKGEIVESNQGVRLTARPVFFQAVMTNGVIDVPSLGDGGKSL